MNQQIAPAILLIRLDWDDFLTKFKPVLNPYDDNASWDGFLLETYGIEYEYVKATYNINPQRVWTIIDGDEGPPILISGWHYVNRLGYIVTAIEFDPKFEYIVDDEEEPV